MERSRGIAFGMIGLIAGGVATWRALQRRRPPDVVEQMTVPSDEPAAPPTAEEERRRGSPADRGKAARIGLDLEGLRSDDGLEPVVQYLTFIQSKRGDSSRMLFVRYDDLDAMAAIEGQEVGSFLSRLDQMGVVISNN